MSDVIAQKPATATAPLVRAMERLRTVLHDAELEDRLDRLVAAMRLAPVGSFRLVRLEQEFGLSPFETDVATLVGLPEEHELLTHIARRIHPRGEPWFTFGSLAECLALDNEGRRHLRSALDEGPLVRFDIIRSEPTLPLPERSQHLATGLWSAVRGVDHWPAGLRPIERTGHEHSILDPALVESALAPRPGVVLVSGLGWAPGDAASAAASSLRALGHDFAMFDAAQVDGAAGSTVSAHLVARGRVPVVIGTGDGPPLPSHPGPVVLCSSDATDLHLDDRPVVSLDLGERTLSDNIEMWRSLVPELNGGAETLGGYLRVDHRRAQNAVADARATARNGGRVLDVDSIVRHVRRRTDTSLPASLRLRRPRASWESLVTTEPNDDLLRSVVARFQNQVRVLEDWGFATARNAAGVCAMFSGPPGTGKTLSAEVIAGALGLDLLVVDLSALVSKWLGETEKNISEVFDAADRCQAVLFFDEADSIFAKRTDAGDAQGRWANLETAHLLTRLEASRGLVILATNLRSNIDEAFVRRLDVIVEFKEPGPAERLRLWQAHLPEQAPLDAGVQLDRLAALYEVTGGLIRNAALDAAFRSAASDTPIDQRSLILSIEREYQKAGRSFPGIPRSLAGVQPGGTTHGN